MNVAHHVQLAFLGAAPPHRDVESSSNCNRAFHTYPCCMQPCPSLEKTAKVKAGRGTEGIIEQDGCRESAWTYHDSPGEANCRCSLQGQPYGRIQVADGLLKYTFLAPCSPSAPAPAPVPVPAPAPAPALAPGPSIGQFRAVAPASSGACTVQYIQVRLSQQCLALLMPSLLVT